jgi:hypothetical protein
MPFINTTQLAKLVKNAYKSEIVIGKTQGGYLLHTGAWTLWFKAEEAPNKVLAIIAETIGKIPADNDPLLIYGANHEGQPMEVTAEHFSNIMQVVDGYRLAIIPYKLTPITIGSARLIQNEASGSVSPIHSELMALLVSGKINPDIEGDPVGPARLAEDTRLCWFNSLCRLYLHPTVLREHGQEIADYLELTQLYKEDA